MATGKTFVRPFQAPKTDVLETAPLSVMFVLRAVLQLDQAIEQDVASCTDLPPTSVRDALLFCQAHGFVEPVAVGWRISTAWFREIVDLLKRQHLLTT